MPGHKPCQRGRSITINSLFMKRINKSLILLLAATSLSALGAAPGQPPPTNAAAAPKSSRKTSDLFPDTDVAKGKGVEVKRSELDEEVIRTRAGLAARQTPVPPDLDARVLDGMISTRLILSKATEADKAK